MTRSKLETIKETLRELDQIKDLVRLNYENALFDKNCKAIIRRMLVNITCLIDEFEQSISGARLLDTRAEKGPEL